MNGLLIAVNVEVTIRQLIFRLQLQASHSMGRLSGLTVAAFCFHQAATHGRSLTEMRMVINNRF